jgi:hypothetical protein
MPAATFNFTGRHVLEQGASLTRTLKLTKKGVVWNLTGYTAKLQVKNDYSSDTSIITLTSEPDGGLVVDGANGTITIFFSVADILLLVHSKAYVYDLLIVDPGALTKPKKIIKGEVFAEPGVTRI